VLEKILEMESHDFFSTWEQNGKLLWEPGQKSARDGVDFRVRSRLSSEDDDDDAFYLFLQKQQIVFV
jgi:hypothetical protein